jgi:probable rRNA maturation factor
MIKVNVIVDNNIWKKNIKNPENYLKKKIKKIEKNNFFKKISFELSILLTENKKIKKLNNKYRKKDKSTDVLSFPHYQKKEIKNLLKKKLEFYLGDIAINIQKIDCKKNEQDVKKKLNILWIHGLLHLMGYRHKTNKDYKKMQSLEKKLLSFIY